MKERMKNKVTYVDVMLNGRFHRQLKYSYCPLFPIRLEDLTAFIETHCPTLRSKNYTFDFSERKV